MKGASLENVPPERESFPFDKARKFQKDFFDWIDNLKNFCVMHAPTGAGKTAAFTELCKEKDKILLVYPTNALIQQQKKVLEQEGLDVEILDSDSLKGRGRERLKNLKSFTANYRARIIATNPDILQAIIQNQYIDIAGEAMEFFDKIEAIVYDEFHFYNDFESSGILMQSQILSDRNPNSKIAFCSATPNSEYIKYISDVLGKKSEKISASYTEKGKPFRHPVQVKRYSESITEKSDEVLDKIESRLEYIDNPDEHRIVVIFNSAFRSNQFYNKACEKGLESEFEKDNGYDTSSEIEINREAPVLITTSKSEVGLDFDIDLMVMEKPKNASSFLQRFGRAGRKSPAEVSIYNMGKVTWWREEISFPEFEKKIYNSLGLKSSSKHRIEDFMGMRAAKAALDREKDDENKKWSTLYSEIYEDMGKINNYGRWKSFLENLEEQENSENPFSGNNMSRNTKSLLNFVKDCSDVLKTLRGRSINTKIKYPRGNSKSLTSYSLLSVLQYYRIKQVEEEFIEVEPKNPSDNTSIRVKMRGFENEYISYDKNLNQVERKLQKWIKRRISSANNKEEAEISDNSLKYFLKQLKITRSAIPSEISYGEHDFKLTKSDNGMIQLEVE